MDSFSQNDPRKHVLEQQLLQKEGQMELLKKKFDVVERQRTIFMREVKRSEGELREEEGHLAMLESKFSQDQRAEVRTKEAAENDQEAKRSMQVEYQRVLNEIAELEKKIQDKKRILDTYAVNMKALEGGEVHESGASGHSFDLEHGQVVHKRDEVAHDRREYEQKAKEGEKMEREVSQIKAEMIRIGKEVKKIEEELGR